MNSFTQQRAKGRRLWTLPALAQNILGLLAQSFPPCVSWMGCRGQESDYLSPWSSALPPELAEITISSLCQFVNGWEIALRGANGGL